MTGPNSSSFETNLPNYSKSNLETEKQLTLPVEYNIIRNTAIEILEGKIALLRHPEDSASEADREAQKEQMERLIIFEKKLRDNFFVLNFAEKNDWEKIRNESLEEDIDKKLAINLVRAVEEAN